MLQNLREKIVLMAWLIGYSAIIYFFVDVHWTMQVALVWIVGWLLLSGSGSKSVIEMVSAELDDRRVRDINNLIPSINSLKEDVIKLKDLHKNIEDELECINKKLRNL